MTDQLNILGKDYLTEREASCEILVCEYCGKESTGDTDDAINQGWQYGYDASFCPDHNV